MSFKCELCGKLYHTPINRAKCELRCAEIEEENRLNRKALEEMAMVDMMCRRDDIIKELENLNELQDKFDEKVEKFNNDYPDNQILVCDEMLDELLEMLGAMNI